MHLLREGQFGVAATFIAEANAKPPRLDTGELPSQSQSEDQDMIMQEKSWDHHFAVSDADPEAMDLSTDGQDGLEKKFTEMYHILHALKNERDLEPAINWARHHSYALELRGSNLEFELCRLRFVELYCSHGQDQPDDIVGPLRALEYARNTFPNLSSRYMRETSALLGSLAFSPALPTSPYRHVFYNDGAWDHVASSFIREFCGMLGLSEKSPLYSAVTAGGIALPVLEKLERVMGEVGGQWTSVNELPVRFSSPPTLSY